MTNTQNTLQPLQSKQEGTKKQTMEDVVNSFGSLGEQSKSAVKVDVVVKELDYVEDYTEGDEIPTDAILEEVDGVLSLCYYKTRTVKKAIACKDDPVSYALAKATSSEIVEYNKAVWYARRACIDANKVGFSTANNGMIGSVIQREEANATNKIYRLALARDTAGQLFLALNEKKRKMKVYKTEYKTEERKNINGDLFIWEYETKTRIPTWETKEKVTKFCIVSTSRENQRKTWVLVNPYREASPRDYVQGIYTKELLQEDKELLQLLNGKAKALEQYKKTRGTNTKKILKDIEQQVEVLRGNKLDYDLEDDNDLTVQQWNNNLYNTRAIEMAYNR